MSRNPYLLLGIDYGTPPAGARRAFAKAVRRLRADPDTDVTVEELNRALHEIQTLDGDPFDDVSLYRVPADPAAFTATGPGLLAPQPVRLPAGDGTADVSPLTAAATAELADVLDHAVATAATFDPGYLFHDPRGAHR